MATLLCAPTTTLAYEPVGFAHSNQHVLMQVQGLPELGRALAPEEGQAGWALDLDWTSEYTADSSGAAGMPGSEAIVLDAETVNLGLRGSVRLGGWLLEADVPYITHSGGGLDGFIDDWHDFTGLPTGGREQAPRDRLLIRYERDGQAVIDLQQATGGLGDIQLGVARPVGQTVVRMAVKLPTGDADKLTGSGGLGGSNGAGRESAHWGWVCACTSGWRPKWSFTAIRRCIKIPRLASLPGARWSSRPGVPFASRTRHRWILPSPKTRSRRVRRM